MNGLADVGTGSGTLLQPFLNRNGMKFVDVDGCALGLVSVRDGGVIKNHGVLLEPWVR